MEQGFPTLLQPVFWLALGCPTSAPLAWSQLTQRGKGSPSTEPSLTPWELEATGEGLCLD